MTQTHTIALILKNTADPERAIERTNEKRKIELHPFWLPYHKIISLAHKSNWSNGSEWMSAMPRIVRPNAIRNWNNELVITKKKKITRSRRSVGMCLGGSLLLFRSSLTLHSHTAHKTVYTFFPILFELFSYLKLG